MATEKPSRPKWTLGILNVGEDVEVPGSTVLLAPQRQNDRHGEEKHLDSASKDSGVAHDKPDMAVEDNIKKTADGKIILVPQPDNSPNDPLNWSSLRRDLALASLGLHCMVGGGMTPVIAAGFTNVAHEFHIPVPRVAFSTGLFMMGLGIGSVLFSPTAILYGKRPVYLFGAVLFVLSAVWCAVSPNFSSLILARILQGIAISPIECLPSATIAEIFFLHERAFRIGIYTLLLLGGKNLIPLVSAVIIQSLSWRWAFWIVTMVATFTGSLLFFFVPETTWDRLPAPSQQRSRVHHGTSSARGHKPNPSHDVQQADIAKITAGPAPDSHYVSGDGAVSVQPVPGKEAGGSSSDVETLPQEEERIGQAPPRPEAPLRGGSIVFATMLESQFKEAGVSVSRISVATKTPYPTTASGDYFSGQQDSTASPAPAPTESKLDLPSSERERGHPQRQASVQVGYTYQLRAAPVKTFADQLRIYNGRLSQDRWWKAAVRPLILFCYPAVLWSSLIYSCSIGWLIVISESLAIIFRDGPYKFGALATGLVYLSPCIGGVLGTAVAGKVSDVIVQAMARRNGGLYEPEFRLVMALPIALSTGIGLMGFGWSASVNDHWIVPTVFFGVVSFGCSLGSTTAITFCVDSYRQYAAEALVTLNFSKNIFHGLAFSLFVASWLTHDGSKTVYVWIGVIQLAALSSTIPMYIFGKRARLWTLRKNMMERF